MTNNFFQLSGLEWQKIGSGDIKSKLVSMKEPRSFERKMKIVNTLNI